MDLFETILTRRTIKDFKPDPVPQAVLERALDAGRWAQNHRLTQPWRFVVAGSQTKAALARLAATLQVETLPAGTSTEITERIATGAEAKILSKPLLVAVATALEGDAVQRREDYAAVCCALQNIQLAAWAQGLGMQWSTGPLSHDPRSYALWNLNPQHEEIAAILYVGYPAVEPATRARKPLSEVLRYLA